ncbi:hypothetical protein [Niabella drilacis]|uniref:DUF4352 domain-containing protein n=1 Tax=Niabella drilacis (strain DSM 25811 / CCM 8410 / CCUG 62505 / LMG 26954 / E90) TaxID=1285928 RepID=A0A1G6XZI4_NIADE|nr:hypothetical protein [Niabella drilacis]SDD83452.1 hypothetical protein SAMN04487894_11475 [Niabella drilacis]
MKKTNKLLLKTLLFLVSAPLIIAACKKTGTEKENNSTSNVYKGWGSSVADPEGTALHFPQGIELVQAKVAPEEYEEESECTRREYGMERVSGLGLDGKVTLCVNFRNTTSAPINVTLPPGLIFISTDIKKQNGLLSEKVTFEVPAKQVYFHQLNLHCINIAREPARKKDLQFRLGPVTNVQLALDLLKFLETKDLHKNPEETGAVIGTALANVQQGRFSKYILGELDKLPNK